MQTMKKYAKITRISRDKNGLVMFEITLFNDVNQ